MSKSKSTTAFYGHKLAALGVVSALTAAAMPAYAQAIKDIEDAQRNTAVLKAQIEEVKAKQELDALMTGQILTPTGRAIVGNSGNRGRVGGSSANGSGVHLGDGESQTNMGEIPPQVLAIFGVNKSLYASLVYPSGLRQDVRAGDDIEGGFRVKSITPSRVTLTKDGKSIPLSIFVSMNADKERSSRR